MVIVQMPLLSRFAFGKDRSGFTDDAPIPANAHEEGTCIYQRRWTKKGMVTVKEKYYKPTNPPSGAQTIRRSKFADAILAWRALTADEKETFRILGMPHNLPGYHKFLSDFMRGLV